MKDTRGFVTFKSVLNIPGNPCVEVSLRVEAIVVFGPCADDFIKLGAASQIGTMTLQYFAIESPEEIQQRIEQALLETKRT